MTVTEKIVNHNKSVSFVKQNVYSEENYNLITAGAKRKRFCLYSVWIYFEEVRSNYNGRKTMQKFKEQSFVTYLPLDYEKAVAEAIKLSKGVRLNTDVSSLSTSNTSSIPKWKFLRFGKYKFTNVDEIPFIDLGYANFLIKIMQEKRDKDEFGSAGDSEIRRYVLSKQYLELIIKSKKESFLKRVEYIAVNAHLVSNKDFKILLPSECSCCKRKEKKIEQVFMPNDTTKNIQVNICGECFVEICNVLEKLKIKL